MPELNDTYITPMTWQIDRSLDYGVTWSKWAEYTHNRLYRAYKSDTISTKLWSNGHEYPTNYDRFTFATSGETGNYIVGKKHYLPPYNYKERLRYRLAPVSDHYIGPGGGSMWYYGCSPGTRFPAISASVVSRVRSRLIAKLRSNSWDAGQSLGEIPETVAQITSSGEAYVRHVRTLLPSAKGQVKLKYLSVKQLKRFGGVAAGTYLGVIFGIMPLIADMYNLMTTLDEGLSKARLRVTVDQKDTDWGPPANPWTTYHGTFVRGIKESATLELVSPPDFQLWRLGLTNPLSIAWELVSLSFVVDWFVHLGGFINALQQPVGLSYKHGYSSRYLDINARCECRYPGVRPPPLYAEKLFDDTPMVVNVRQRAFKREVLPSIIPPLPYLDLGLNLSKMTTLVALVTSIFTSL